MNNKKLNLLSLATAAYPNLGISDALTAYLRNKYSSDQSVSDLIAKYLYESYRWVYNFDGIDDRAALQFRAINPDGDIDIEWTQIGVSNAGATPQTIVTQSLSATIASREFVLRWNGNDGGLQLSVGGTGLALTMPCLDGKYRVTYVGSTYTVFYNGVLSRTGSFTRGTSRESTAVTVVGCRNSSGSFTEFTTGRLFDVRINGVLWPMGDNNQQIQLPSPTGLGPELITQTVLENPASVGSQWTYLGDGRWQLISDGNYSGLIFITASQQPEAGFVEFEIESISGGSIRCSEGTAGLVANSQFNTPGVKRWYFIQKSLDNRLTFSRNSGGVPVTAIIKNISYKPLWVANAAELLINGAYSNGTASWGVNGGGTFNVVSGQAQLECVANQTSRIEQRITTLEVDAYYIYTADLVSATGCNARLNVIRDVDGGYVGMGGQTVTAGTTNVRLQHIFKAPSNAVLVQLSNDAGPNPGTLVWDNASLRKLDSLCNPMVTSNFNPDRWREVPNEPSNVR